MGVLDKKINQTEQRDNNSIFDQLVNNLSWFHDVPNFDASVYEVSSSVEKITGKWNVKVHNCITLKLPCNSYVRISSYGKKSIELTNINVKGDLHKGMGTILMLTLFMFLKDTLGELPNIVLECTGNLIVDGIEFKNTVQNQSRFFRKFGFRVSNNSGYPSYIQMKLDLRKINLAELYVNFYRKIAA